MQMMASALMFISAGLRYLTKIIFGLSAIKGGSQKLMNQSSVSTDRKEQGKEALPMITNILPEQLRDYVLSSLGKLFSHTLESTRNVVPNASMYVMFRSAAETHETGIVQLQLFDAHDPYGEYLLWETIESCGWSKAEYASLFQWLRDSAYLSLFQIADPIEVIEIDNSDWAYPRVTPKVRAIWRYHPQRQIEATPWGGAITSIARRSNLPVSFDDLNQLMAAFSSELNEFFNARPLRIRAEEKPEKGRAYSRYGEMLTQIVAYLRAGKQIYDFPPVLSELFRNTDIDDIALEHVRLPYPTVYLHFGLQETMPMGDGWFAEGVYFTEIRDESGGRHCNITLACCNESFERFLEFDRALEPGYSIALGPDRQSMSLAEAVELHLSDKINYLKTDIANADKFDAEVAQQIADGLAPPHAVSVRARNSQHELDRLLPRHEAFLKLLRLAVNALVYLNAYPDDIETKWPENTSPSKLRELSKAKDKKTKTRVMSELAKAGFTPVHLCGKRIQEQIEAQKSAAQESDRRTVSMHWVRGHWRHQAHGPGNSLRKIIWRMPLLRGTRVSSDDEPLGHVYLAS